MKESVRLRRRETRSGIVSLYLDTYYRGRREYEFLRLYLYPGNDRETRRKNRETLAMAEAIRAKRTVELRNGAYGFKRSGTGGTAGDSACATSKGTCRACTN